MVSRRVDGMFFQWVFQWVSPKIGFPMRCQWVFLHLMDSWRPVFGCFSNAFPKCGKNAPDLFTAQDDGWTYGPSLQSGILKQRRWEWVIGHQLDGTVTFLPETVMDYFKAIFLGIYTYMHCIALHCIALLYIPLHYITHMYIYIYIHR